MKSIAHRTYLWLLSKPLDSVVKLEQVRAKFPDPAESDSATTAMSMLTNAGAIERIGSGLYKIIPGLEEWGKDKRWTKAPKRRNTPTKTTCKGEDVIENLLTTMALAEPELRRLQKQDKLLREAREL